MKARDCSLKTQALPYKQTKSLKLVPVPKSYRALSSPALTFQSTPKNLLIPVPKSYRAPSSHTMTSQSTPTNRLIPAYLVPSSHPLASRFTPTNRWFRSPVSLEQTSAFSPKTSRILWRSWGATSNRLSEGRHECSFWDCLCELLGRCYLQ